MNAMGGKHQMGGQNNRLSGNNGGGGGGGNVNNSATNLIINYLPQDMSDQELFTLFQTMGPIETSRIMRDFKTNYSFGYAFVNFATEEGAQRAIKCLNGVAVRNKRLKVAYARPAGDEIKETNLYVTNLPRTITEEQVDAMFGPFGQIVQKNILLDKLSGMPRGVAFIRFNKREEAQDAIAALNNVIPDGGSKPLSVRVAEDHGKSKAQLFGGGGGGGGPMNGPMNNMINNMPPPHHHSQQMHPPHMGGNMNGMGGYPMPPGGGGGGGGNGGYFNHPGQAMHRGRAPRYHHQAFSHPNHPNNGNGNMQGGYPPHNHPNQYNQNNYQSPPNAPRHHHHQQRYANGPY